ncbi:MAG: SAM-dependent chlorinase/fluorinase [Bacteroidia bacterium]|nr:SAM-dependent chlorinase/fluorinase [Bacteroidia bacterium]
MNIITLISDFGNGSHYVARVKGILYATLGEVTIVDISHDIASWNLEQAIFILAATHKTFDGNVIHLIGINEQTTSHIVAKCNNHWYIAPDNGILPEVLKNEEVVYYGLGKHEEPTFLETLYPRIAKTILDGSFVTSAVEINLPTQKLFKIPRINKDSMQAFYAYFDKYGNAVVNLTKKEFYDFVGNSPFVIRVTEMDAINRITESYYKSEQGELIAIFNAAGFLEISVTFGNAKQLFGFHRTQCVIINRNV